MASEADISRLVTALNDLANDMRQLVSTNSALINEKQRELEATRDSIDAIEEETILTKKHITEATKDLKLSKEATEVKRRAISDAEDYNKAQRETIELKKQLNALDRAEVVDQRARQSLLDKIRSAEERESQAKNKATNSFKELSAHTNNFGKQINWAGASLRLFGTALVGQARQLAKQYKASGGVIEGTGNALADLWNLQIEGLKRGVSGEELIKVANANRRVFNALGGTEEALKALDPAIDTLKRQGFEADEALRIATSQASDFANYGVKPSMSAMLNYNRELVNSKALLGKSTPELHALFDEVANDTDSLTILKAAREDEREAILASQRALIRQAAAAGMSAEQAKLAAKMLNQMTAAKPLDRLKQAAKIRAMGGALGIAGADEAARGVIAGKRATDQQKQAIQDFGIAATNAIDTAAQGGLGAEIFASSLVEKLDLDTYLGSQSPFSTSLASSVAPMQAALDKQVNQTDGMAGDISEILTTLNGIKNNVFPNISATIMTAAGVIVTAMAAKAGAGLLSKFGGKAGGGRSTLGKAASFGKNLVKGGLVGSAIGFGGNYLGDKLAESGHATAGSALSGAATGAGIGATIGSVVPGVGTLIGGGIGGLIGGGIGWYQGMAADQPGVKPAALIPPKTKPASTTEQAMQNQDLKDATLQTADRLSVQVKQMDDSNAILRGMADMLQKQNELAEKQLIALTMTEKERTSASTKATLNQGSKYGSQYGYV